MKFFGKWHILYQWIGWRAREWDIQYRKKPVDKRKTAPQWRYVYDAGVHSGKGTCCFKIRYNENYLTILIEIPHVDKRYDLESCVKFDLKKTFCVRQQRCLLFFEWPSFHVHSFFTIFSLTVQHFIFSVQKILHKHRIYVSDCNKSEEKGKTFSSNTKKDWYI